MVCLFFITFAKLRIHHVYEHANPSTMLQSGRAARASVQVSPRFNTNMRQHSWFG